MKKLLELTKDFGVSRPVFRLQLDSSGRAVSANMSQPIHKYRPTPTKGDVLSEWVCENYMERFENGGFVINRNEIALNAMSDIRRDVVSFVEKNLDMRNPRQSKLYRWTSRNMPITSEVNDVLVMVYKYLRSFADRGMKAHDPNHIKNGIAILEAIMEKYE